MKVVTCVGYYGTGSSAITDLMKEYVSVSCKSDYEISIIYQYRGINNLYYHFIKNPVRVVSNNAIKEFDDLCDCLCKTGTTMNYNLYFEGTLEQAKKNYINKICGESYPYIFSEDFNQLSVLKQYVHRVINKIYKIIINDKNDFKRVGSFIKPRNYYLHTTDENYFFQCTKEFFIELFSKINNKEYLMIDQLVPCSSINLCSHYFDDLKVVLVDRDPRDIYLLEKYVWHGGAAPIENIEMFCKWYHWNRVLPGNDGSNILRIQFEDLIFKYLDTVKRIENFIGLKSRDHREQYKYFQPEISKNNCRLWQKISGEENNLHYIERELKEYLYEEQNKIYCME